MTEAELEQVAALVAERIGQTPEPWIAVAEAAEHLGCSTDYLRGNAQHFGGVRIGPGRRGPLRFKRSRLDLAATGDTYEASRESRDAEPGMVEPITRPRRRTVSAARAASGQNPTAIRLLRSRARGEV